MYIAEDGIQTPRLVIINTIKSQCFESLTNFYSVSLYSNTLQDPKEE